MISFNHCRYWAIVAALLLFPALISLRDTEAQETRASPHGSFNAACDICHSPASWKVELERVRFDHEVTPFPLTGRHRTASCRSCHPTLKFDQVGMECATCHQDIHSSQFGLSCNVCHTPERWNDLERIRRNHDQTRFPLVGTHRTLDCSRCHTGGRFAGTPVDCNVCHLELWRLTASPSHSLVGFGTNCARCHSPAEAWTETHYAHTPAFPLTGGHQTFRCESCHTNGVGPLSSVCFSCHEGKYREAANPNHVSAGFGTDCRTCHTTDAWRPATFDHTAGGFPLTGAHRRIMCNACHTGGNYTNRLPTDCYGCHRSNYDATSNPNHQQFGFSLICTSCHTTDAWRPSSFDHTRWFPIYSGSHRGKWTLCTDCHRDTADYGIFTCITCHERSSTNDHHGDVSGYRYESTSCYRCHPAGSGGD